MTLNAYSTGTFTFVIPINDELQERIPVDLSDINPGTPIAIKTYLNQLENPTMFVIEMNPQPVTAGDMARAVYSGVKKVKDGIIGTFTDVKSLVSGGLSYIGLTEIVGVSASTAGAISGGVVLYLKLWQYVANTPVSEDTGDNNLIIGD
ncbi:MAG: hypothetical protein H0Z18_07775 [Thermococcus sp.]|uniref:hypothetical protein n=1 Tax=Thermococcus sp. TaxID=35749 RepID=UPI001D64F918|nr:hypothetical protein [Thermococcus sp.]MBO8175140.1 hypothetical protein [Thermococcus sp.]